MLIATTALLLLNTTFCEVVGVATADQPSLPPAAYLVRDAALIVRARATGVDTSKTPDHAHRVLFEVLEVLKSRNLVAPATLAIDGAIDTKDDFNPRPVPYDQVRPSGLYGSCFARTYRAGAEYLLMLEGTAPATLNPYWAPLLPTNEQLHGADDPWLAWVRARVAQESGRGRPPGNNLFEIR